MEQMIVYIIPILHMRNGDAEKIRIYSLQLQHHTIEWLTEWTYFSKLVPWQGPCRCKFSLSLYCSYAVGTKAHQSCVQSGANKAEIMRKGIN